MSTEKDELADVIAATLDDGEGEGHEPCVQDRALAHAILAAGYRKPRTITTAEELDALPDHAIIRDDNGNALRAVKRIDGKNWWVDGREYAASEVTPLPATVLWGPK